MVVVLCASKQGLLALIHKVFVMMTIHHDLLKCFACRRVGATRLLLCCGFQNGMFQNPTW
jgi:hypothetical protein